MSRSWSCLDHDRRVQLEVLYRAGHSKREMAALLGVHLSTIYRELRRGLCRQRDTEWREYYTCFYCHPYTSCERGSNENANRLIRRWFKKGRSLAAVNGSDCLRVARWMNTYPRQVLGWKTASEAFREACESEGIKISPYLSQFLS